MIARNIRDCNTHTHTLNVSQHYIDIPKFHDHEPCINKLESLTYEIPIVNLLSVFDLVDSIYIIFL